MDLSLNKRWAPVLSALTLIAIIAAMFAVTAVDIETGQAVVYDVADVAAADAYTVSIESEAPGTDTLAVTSTHPAGTLTPDNGIPTNRLDYSAKTAEPLALIGTSLADPHRRNFVLM